MSDKAKKWNNREMLEHLDAYPDSFGRTFGGQWIVWNEDAPNRSQAGRFDTIREAIAFHMDRWNED